MNIKKAYGGNVVLDGFSHCFSDGKVTAVVGASGCGKSTLLSVLMGIIPADGGEVILPENAKKSAVFQEDRLCENLTVSANIRLVTGKKYNVGQIAEELCRVGLDGCENKVVRELSGGMKRRTALLRALLAEYDVLFLDEPFKGLDEDTKQSVMEYCRQSICGRTTVFVTHDKDECEFLADEVVKLNK